MTYSNFTKHAASNDGNLRAQAQQNGWRESLAQWFMGGLPSLLLMLLLSWGLIVPTQAASIFSYPGPVSGSPVKPVPQSPDSDPLDLANTNFTLAACVNLAKYNVNYSATIYSKRGLQNGYFLGVDANKSSYTDGTVKFKVQGPQGPDVRSTPGAILLGKTYDVVLVYKSGLAYIYINGNLDPYANGKLIAAPVATDKPLRIGMDSQPLVDQGLPHVWNGTLSLLQIHNVALTETEIKNHDAKCRSLPTLTVNKNGTGTVSSSPAGISCGNACTANYAPNTSVTLTATPAAGFTFGSWTGCTSTTTTCQVSMSQAQTVTATFNPNQTLTVTKNGTGSGTVSSNPAGISCGTDCTESYAFNTAVTLTATASPGSIFTGWSGGCTGTARTCSLTMSQIKTVTATFKLSSRLIVNKTDDGGTVTITGQSITVPQICGDQCLGRVVPVVQGSSVTLTVTPIDGFDFTGWMVGNTVVSSLNTYTVSVTQNTTVTATFVPSNRSAVRSNSCGTPCQVDVAKDTKATYDPATGVLHLPAIEVLGQAGESEVFQADLVWKTDNSNSWFELVSRHNSTALAGSPENAIYNLETNTLMLPFVAVQGSDGTQLYTGELQLISSDPQRFMVTQVREIEGSLSDSLPPNR